MTKKEGIKPEPASRKGHIVAQTAEELQFSYYHCKTCGEINFKPDSRCPGPDSGDGVRK